jgi:hypothetical protein
VPVADTPSADSWGKDDNARRYDAFARRFPMYARSSQELIALACPPRDATEAELLRFLRGCEAERLMVSENTRFFSLALPTAAGW